jgi:hypothetical protein
MLASPTSAFTWLSAKRQQSQNFHSWRTIGTVVRSHYTIATSIRGLFFFLSLQIFPSIYKLPHGIKFSIVKKLTPGTSIEHLNDQNMFMM